MNGSAIIDLANNHCNTGGTDNSQRINGNGNALLILTILVIDTAARDLPRFHLLEAAFRKQLVEVQNYCSVVSGQLLTNHNL